MSQYSTTVAQYTQFLNAVAANDPYGLYNVSMGTRQNVAGIARAGVSGSYSYSSIGSPNKPVAYTSWADAARYANWLTNGQPLGAEAAGTTETGSYTLNGATIDAALDLVTRNSNARFVIPTRKRMVQGDTLF